MKILVTGSNGQLGSELKDLVPAFPEFQFIFLDRASLPLENKEAIEKVFLDHQPQYFINCAAYTAVDKAEEEKDLAFAINGHAVGIIAEKCSKYNCRLIHISTDYVFNGNNERPFLEDDPRNPLNIYGESKLLGEELAINNLPTSIIIRTSWVYSAYGKNFVKTMLRLMNEKESINVVNDQVGSPTYAADLAKAIIQIISSGKWVPGIFHFSNEGQISWFDFASEIKKISGLSCQVNPIGSISFPTPAKRPSYSVMNTGKIREAFKINIRNWKDSLRECLEKLSAIH